MIFASRRGQCPRSCGRHSYPWRRAPAYLARIAARPAEVLDRPVDISPLRRQLAPVQTRRSRLELIRSAFSGSASTRKTGELRKQRDDDQPDGARQQEGQGALGDALQRQLRDVRRHIEIDADGRREQPDRQV